MAYAVQFRRGTTANHASFTGEAGEVTVNTTTNELVVHDGTTVGGHTVGGVSTDPSFQSLTVVGDLDVSGATKLAEIHENVTTNISTTGTLLFDATTQGVLFATVEQTADREINFTNVNSSLAVGESFTAVILLTQGTTAYYVNAYKIDDTVCTPKWSGGSAPTEGNADSIDTYSFTIIKTADATFTVMASLTQFA
ncbi:hypothetical protein N9E09_01085 [bacterium]|jgi:hypothetical protein|nr:hypothetical protein [bacterium]